MNMMIVNSKSVTSRNASWHDLPVTTVFNAQQLRSELVHDTVDAAFWARETPPGVLQWLENVGPDSWPRGRFVLTPLDVQACLTDLFAATGVDATPALLWLQEDVTHLAHSVQKLIGSTRIRLRLETIFDNACSKFHIDNVVARLICTYYGPGTELSLQDQDLPCAVPTGAPVLLKGKRWLGGEVPALRHRSPPIEGTGKARLVLVIEGCELDEVNPGYDQVYPQTEAARAT